MQFATQAGQFSARTRRLTGTDRGLRGDLPVTVDTALDLTRDDVLLPRGRNAGLQTLSGRAPGGL